MFLRRHNASLLARAPAKLNLFLEVLGKRPDGYHDLETLMVKIDLCDDLIFSPADDISPTEISLTADLSLLPGNQLLDAAQFSSSENLISKAARLLQSRTGTQRGVAIHVRKRIPLESGLAGGSTDAATTLVALNEFWGLGLSVSELQELSAELGSDIPFFFTPSVSAICRGRGECVESLPNGPELIFVIARPPSGLSTPLVFKNLKLAGDAVSIEEISAAWKQGRGLSASKQLFNRLQPTAESLNSDVVRLRNEFERLPFIGHQMSGSGTSYFGISHSRRQARRLARSLRSRGVGSVFIASSRV